MSEQRHGRNQAVRIPVEFELPGDEAIMYRDGVRLVIEPVRKRGLLALLKSMKPLDEDFPAIEDPVPAPEASCDALFARHQHHIRSRQESPSQGGTEHRKGG